MIKHLVFWRVRDDEDKQKNMKKMRELLTSLVGVVPGLVSAEVGFNYNPKGFDIALYSVFESKEALDGYQIHPAHLEVKKFVHSVIIDRACADYEI